MTYVVTGATGTVGRHVVEHLTAAGHQVRAVTRNPAKAALPAGVEVVAGDLRKADTLVPALEGATGLHLINFGGDALLDNGAEIVELTAKAGVRRVTVLCGGEPGSVEAAVAASDLDWTLLQPVEFMSNALDWSETIRTEGVVRDGFPDRLSAMVHESDIGAVAAAVLTSDGHRGKAYVITGPEVLTVPDKVSAIGAAIGRDIEFVALTEEQARDHWRASGYPDEVIEFFIMVFGNTPEVGYTVVPTVQQLTGRPARTFTQWAVENAEAFRN